eukprot:5906388-Alexandrium_andersonii.AAC.1
MNRSNKNGKMLTHVPGFKNILGRRPIAVLRCVNMKQGKNAISTAARKTKIAVRAALIQPVSCRKNCSGTRPLYKHRLTT